MKTLNDWLVVSAFVGLILGVLIAFIFGIIYEDRYSGEGVLALLGIVVYPIPICVIVGAIVGLFKESKKDSDKNS